MGLEATRIAYTEGYSWLEEAKLVYEESIKYTVEYINNKCSPLNAYPSECGYTCWIEYTKLDVNEAKMMEMLEKANIYVYPGSRFGVDHGKYFRLNCGIPKKILKMTLERLFEVINKLNF